MGLMEKIMAWITGVVVISGVVLLYLNWML